MHNHTYAHPDDHPHLTGDDLAGKVLRYIRYTALIDTSAITVIGIGRTVILSGHVACEADLGCAQEAAASVIGVHLIDNRLQVAPVQ